MNASRSQTHLRNLEAAPFAQKNIFFWHPHVVKANVHMTSGSMVFTKYLHAL